MDSAERSSDTPQSPETGETSGIGIVRDMQQLGTHRKATASELREFLAQARGRSPQEVLGMVAGSRLTRSIAMAVVGAAFVLVVGTIVPWLMRETASDHERSENATATVPATTEQAKEPDAPQEAPTTEAATTAASATPKPSPADAQKAVNVMGLGETKTADPNSNPLENKLDKLLDNLE